MFIRIPDTKTSYYVNLPKGSVFFKSYYAFEEIKKRMNYKFIDIKQKEKLFNIIHSQIKYYKLTEEI